jgi:hypothetical protein
MFYNALEILKYVLKFVLKYDRQYFKYLLRNQPKNLLKNWNPSKISLKVRLDPIIVRILFKNLFENMSEKNIDTSFPGNPCQKINDPAEPSQGPNVIKLFYSCNLQMFAVSKSVCSIPA